MNPSPKADVRATPNRPPLWKVMERTSGTVANWDEMICAVRDWLVPEEEPPLGPAGKAHAELRALLTTEVDRAERGDG